LDLVFCFSAARDWMLDVKLPTTESRAAEKQKGREWVACSGNKQVTPLGFPGRTK
jgi:hypothetical protein